MYKVFFNDRMLLITSRELLPAGICFEHLDYAGRKQLGKAIGDFEDSSARNYGITSDNPDELFRMFTSFYLILEAAGGIVRSDHGKVLFIKRFGKWDLPKGKIESGETPDEGALREVSEECGIKNLRIAGVLPPTYHTYRTDGIRMLKKTNWFAMVNEPTEKPVPQTEEGISEAIWLVPAQFDLVLQNTYRSIAELINDVEWSDFF